MGKSRSESPLPGAFFSSLREAEGDAAISRDLRRGRGECLARAKNRLLFIIARSAATKQSRNGQPEMRQA
ncbi:MAG: hypothetical protein WBH01_04490 [Dehalococcoidia bacterium]